LLNEKTDVPIAQIFRNQNSCHRLSLNVVFEQVSIPSHENLRWFGTQANYWIETHTIRAMVKPRPHRG